MWQSIAYYGWLIVESALGVFGIRLYEEPRYDVIDRIGDRVEIRRYAPRLAAEVDLESTAEADRGKAFQLLFAYIAGANRSSAFGRDRIAMTTPVELGDKELVAMTVPVETLDSAGAGHMRFFLPTKFTLDTAPKPLNPRVRLIMVSEETIATLRFSGSATDVVKPKAQLIATLADAKWRPNKEPYTLLYDAPFTLPFLRRNEAAVAVVKAP
jgi:SOUL heme-binding protein